MDSAHEYIIFLNWKGLKLSIQIFIVVMNRINLLIYGLFKLFEPVVQFIDCLYKLITLSLHFSRVIEFGLIDLELLELVPLIDD